MPSSPTELAFFPKEGSTRQFAHDGRAYDLAVRVREMEQKLAIPEGTTRVSFTRLGYTSLHRSDPSTRPYGSVTLHSHGGKPPKVMQLQRNAFEAMFEQYRTSDYGKQR